MRWVVHGTYSKQFYQLVLVVSSQAFHKLIAKWGYQFQCIRTSLGTCPWSTIKRTTLFLTRCTFKTIHPIKSSKSLKIILVSISSSSFRTLHHRIYTFSSSLDLRWPFAGPKHFPIVCPAAGRQCRPLLLHHSLGVHLLVSRTVVEEEWPRLTTRHRTQDLKVFATCK